MRFPSQAPLLISCTLPLVTIAQQPAGSFHERTASHISFQQSCPPDFPMPDIWKWQCAGQIDLPPFAPARLTSCFGWNRPLIFGPVPAEKVSWRLQQRVEATPRTRPTPDLEALRFVAFSFNSTVPISLDRDVERTYPTLPMKWQGGGAPDYCSISIIE